MKKLAIAIFLVAVLGAPSLDLTQEREIESQ
jgi:hypothetical protein